MKTTQTTIAVLVLLIFAMSCSKDNSDTVVKEKTVEDISITTEKVSTPIAPKLINSNNLSAVWIQLVGNNIIYSSHVATPATNLDFMLKYNLTLNSFSNVTPNNVNCYCGYTNSFVTDNTNLFMIANDARKYTVATNVWSDINYPAAIKDNNGETGMAHSNGKIYVCGGRVPSKRFVCYDISSNTWSNRNDYIENIETSEMVAVDNKIYLLGGNSSNTNFSVYDIATNTWAAKGNLNFTLNTDFLTNIVTSVKNRYIFVLSNGKIYSYDLVKDQWKTDPITAPLSRAQQLFTLNDNTLLLAGLSTTGDFSLYKLTLSLP